MIRMLVVDYLLAIRSERLISREVQVNLAYRWFASSVSRDAVPDHFSVLACSERAVREGDVFRRMFERVVEACIAAT
jgi:transposase